MSLKYLILCLFAFSCLAQKPDLFTIAGHVVGPPVDHRGVKGARVSIILAKDSEHQVTTFSGDNGEFSFQGIPAGKYQLRIVDHGAVQLYQQTDVSSTAVIVGPGKDSEHILFVLNSPASISGTVLDEGNDPVPQATVYLFVRSVVLGRYLTHRCRKQPPSQTGLFIFVIWRRAPIMSRSPRRLGTRNHRRKANRS